MKQWVNFSMESFNELLSQYIQRTGISDAELARTIGVSRQTIFRWREGLTGRPRHRDDVLEIARKLRLTSDERDELLLAAGFRPVQVGNDVQTTQPTSPAAAPESKPRLSRPRLKTVWIGAIMIILIVAVAWAAYWLRWPTVLRLGAAEQASSPLPGQAEIPDEVIILVAQFANYASSQVGYNVAGRLTEALQQEIKSVQLDNFRVETWPEAVGTRAAALQAGTTTGATLVIYGEYDAGRVVVEFAHPADVHNFSDPALRQYVAGVDSLSAVINTDLPRQVRSLALIALGQIQLTRDQPDRARALLHQARSNLQAEPEVEPKSWALVNFYLGLAHYRSDPPDLDRAIAAYDLAVESWPEMISSRLNRIAAYEARNQPGDLDIALADADAVVNTAPEWGHAYNNRASVRLMMGGPTNLALAVKDLDQALDLDPNLAEAYLNRAYGRFGQDLTIDEIRADVDQALELRPDYGNALNLLCWGYALEQRVEIALPYCNRAINEEPDVASFRDSRGLALALRGDHAAAITDFESYVAWLETEPAGLDWQQDLARRRTWIEGLARGDDPITPEVLALLRSEFGR
jgi:tetratricopeptide (TPR) repeat protein/DNA-binding XRE family transcriptional regulator